MKEQLTIRLLKSKNESFLDSYEGLNSKWIKSVSCLTVVIQGYLEDPEFVKFVDCLRNHRKYEVNYIHRKYSKSEINNAELFTLSINATFEPTGEELGTKYLLQCEDCKIRQKDGGPLIINTSRIPKTADIAETIARDEWVVNEKVRNLLTAGSFTGFTLEKVQSSSRSHLNSPWYQLQVNSSIKLSAQTRFGDSFRPNLDIDSVRSQCGHLIKHLAYSELFLDKSSWDGSDMCVTNYHFDGQINLIYPFQYIIISNRLYRQLTENKIKGYSVEVAYLI